MVRFGYHIYRNPRPLRRAIHSRSPFTIYPHQLSSAPTYNAEARAFCSNDDCVLRGRIFISLAFVFSFVTSIVVVARTPNATTRRRERGTDGHISSHTICDTTTTRPAFSRNATLSQANAYSLHVGVLTLQRSSDRMGRVIPTSRTQNPSSR